MRAGFGLIALLLGVGLMFYLMSSSASVDLKAKKQADEQVQQFSGKDKTGEIVTKSMTFEAGQKGVMVKSIVPDGAMAQRFGLQTGDLITEIGPLQATDDATADAYLRDAYRDNRDLTVRRGSQTLTLPAQRTDGVSPADQPGQPTRRTSPQGQALDLVHKIETH